MSGRKYFSNLIHKLLHNNRFVAVFSVIIAITIWLVISISENPQMTMTISGVPLSIDVSGTQIETFGMDVVSKNLPKEVSVTVDGPSYIVSSLKSTDIIVTPVSLANVTEAGTYEIELIAKNNSSKTGYTVISINPAKITVSFDAVDTRTFDVLPQIKGNIEVAEGLVQGETSISNVSYNKITIKGPRTEMNKISNVAAVASVNKTMSKTETFSAEIVLYDNYGKELDSSLFDLSFTNVDIVVPILKEKTVPIVLESASSSAINNISYSISKKTVTLRGEPSKIDKITAAYISTVNFSEFSKINADAYGNYKLVTTLDLPTGVEISGDKEIEITFKLSNYINKTFNITNLKTKDLNSDLKATFSKNSISITVCGPSNVVNSIKPENLTIYANCSGKTEGVYTLDCTLDSSVYPEIWCVGNITASVTIK